MLLNGGMLKLHCLTYTWHKVYVYIYKFFFMPMSGGISKLHCLSMICHKVSVITPELQKQILPDLIEMFCKYRGCVKHINKFPTCV